MSVNTLVLRVGVTGKKARKFESEHEAATVTSEHPRLMSLRAFGRHCGLSAPGVLRWIEAGRLKRCLVVDALGRRKIDPALADADIEHYQDTRRDLADAARAAVVRGLIRRRPIDSAKYSAAQAALSQGLRSRP